MTVKKTATTKKNVRSAAKKAAGQAAERRLVSDSMILTAKAQGEARGIRKGRREGLEKGLQEGLQKGRGEERVKNIKSMYGAGATVAQIVKGFGLPEKDVKHILGLGLGLSAKKAKKKTRNGA